VAAAAKKLGLATGNSPKAASVPSAAPRKGFDLGKLNAMRVDIAAVSPAQSLDPAAFPLQVEFQDPRKTVKVRSPDGKKMVWRGLEAGKGYYLFIADADGSNPRRLDACKNGYQPVWSPDSKRILYSAMDWKIEERNLFIYDLAANSAKRAFNASKKVGPLASWSPDGSKIVFTYFDELWITNASGIGRSMLNLSRRTQTAVSDARLFAWSADGSRLAYAAREGGPIHLIDLTSKI
jgi:Tol biopolymer transport system component